MRTNLLLSGLLIILLSSCNLFKKNSEMHSHNPSELNAKWQVLSIQNAPIAAQVNGKTPTFSFDFTNKTYSAITGCNNLMGEFSLSSPNKISFTRGMSTMMACDDMSVERGLSSILTDITTYSIQGDTLSFFDKNSVLKATFLLIKEDNSALLSGKWEVSYIHDAVQPVDVLFSTQKPTIVFDTQENTLSGNAGCNNYSSTFTLNNQHLKFGAIASTKMACPSLEGESIFIKAIQNVSSFTIKEGTLSLFSADTEVLKFKKIK